MATALHTLEQGQRVHYLANLGGLVTLAGLDRYDPELLLGVFCEIAQRVPTLPDTRQAALRENGKARLAARGAEKRAWTAWQRAQQLHQVVLTTSQLQYAIRLLGGSPSVHAEDLVALFTALLREVTDATA